MRNKSIEQSWPASNVSLWPINKIKPYDKNPRTHPDLQVELIAQSMREDGVTAPILVDENGIIIYGHGRLAAAIKSGFTQYPVAVAHGLTEQKKKALRIKDNSLASMSDWNPDLIALELQELRLDGYDLNLFGFSDNELSRFAVQHDGLRDPDDAPEAPQEPVSRLGDIWILGSHRLVCGDSTAPVAVSEAIKGVIPHLMVTDPPYGVSYDADWRNKAFRANGSPIGGRAIGPVLNDAQSDWREAWALFPGDVAYCWHAGLHASSTQLAFEACGFQLRSQIIWAKQQFVIGRGHYHVQHEPCFYMVRKGSTGHWASDRKQTTLWHIDKPRKSETGHSTQKPVECMKRPIENNSSPGQAIYEPFSGSGTTIIAAEMTGRCCHAIELNPAYVDVAVNRWQNFTGKEATCDGKNMWELQKNTKSEN